MRKIIHYPPYFYDPNPYLGYVYARDVIKGRWEEAEPVIMKDPKWALVYAIEVLHDRWKEAESIIINDPSLIYEYAVHVINGRWPEAEKYIKGSVWQNSYEYQFDVII